MRTVLIAGGPLPLAVTGFALNKFTGMRMVSRCLTFVRKMINNRWTKNNWVVRSGVWSRSAR